MFQPLAPVLAIPLLWPLDQRLLGDLGRGGHCHHLLGGGAQLLLNQPGGSAVKRALFQSNSFRTYRLEEQSPAGPEPAEHIIDPCGDCNEFGFRGAFKVGTPIAEACLEGAVLVEDDARRDEARPGEVV